jgi:hypothetical protein
MQKCDAGDIRDAAKSSGTRSRDLSIRQKGKGSFVMDYLDGTASHLGVLSPQQPTCSVRRTTKP